MTGRSVKSGRVNDRVDSDRMRTCIDVVEAVGGVRVTLTGDFEDGSREWVSLEEDATSRERGRGREEREWYLG